MSGLLVTNSAIGSPAWRLPEAGARYTPDMPSLSDSDNRLLDLIREGRVDAEIAVRLGLSTGEVRERTAELARRLGVAGKVELRALREPRGVPVADGPVSDLRSSPPTRRVFAAAAAAGVVLFAIGVWLGRFSAGEKGPDLVVVSAGSPTAVVTQPPPTREPPPVLTIDGESYLGLGQIVSVPGHPFPAVVAVEQREALAIVTLAGPGLVQFQGPYLRPVRNGSVYAETIDGTPPIAIFALPADENTELFPIDGGVAVYAKGDALPRLLVWASETRGVAQDTRGLRRFRATVDSSGALFVSVAPISAALAIDSRTGDSLDLSNARKIGALPRLLGTTSCDAEDGCRVVWSGTEFAAPFAGVARCSAGGALEYEDVSSGVRLAFTPFNGSPIPPCPASIQAVRAGDPLVGGWYLLLGMDAAGQPIGLAVAGDGSLYAGAIAPKAGCPCVGSN